MNAKLILIAAMATVIVVALAVGFGSRFGNGSGNFSVTMSRSITESATEVISISHKGGAVKLSRELRTNGKPYSLAQVADDMIYNYSPIVEEVGFQPTGKWALDACAPMGNSTASVKSLTDYSIVATSDGNMEVRINYKGGNGEDAFITAYTIKMDGKNKTCLSIINLLHWDITL